MTDPEVHTDPTAHTHDNKIAPDKPITLVLTRYGDYFHVTAVVNTTYYRPGDVMTRQVAEMCCRMPNWTVQMVDNQILSTILGMAGGVGRLAGAAVGV